MNLKHIPAAGLILLGGCASPWVAYQEAVRCHLDDKGPECDAKYQKAIGQDTKMQGVHSSYGTHLLLQGKTDQANEEFKIEQLNYPTESSKAIAALAHPLAGSTPETPSARPVDTATAVNALPDATPPAPSVINTIAPASKTKTKAVKKGVTHAK